MKKLISTVFVVLLMITSNAFAQENVVTLHHEGNTTVYYGPTCLTSAYNAAVEGDTLILSPGSFPAFSSNKKRLHIFGAGHAPDTVSSEKVFRTVVEYASLGNGADSNHIEGIYFNSTFTINNSLPLTGVTIRRCNLYNLNFSGGGELNDITIESNVFRNSISYSTTAAYSINFRNKQLNDVIVRNNICADKIMSISSTSVVFISNNVFWGAFKPLYSVYNTTIKNNVFYSGDMIVENSFFSNNMCLDGSLTTYTNNLFSNNYLGVSADSVFVNTPEYYNATTGANSFDYSHDFHLKYPSMYTGTDGTQIGIYGGSYPYKESAWPSIPHIATFEVGTYPDSTGYLPINIKVIPQDD